MLKINEVARLAKISKRTLQYYDNIGLLCPAKTESGYRLYGKNDLADLQQILFFRELGFPLKEISAIIHSPSFDRREALSSHRNTLKEKRDNIDRMLANIDKTIESMEGGWEMSDKERFDGFDFSEGNAHEKEARKIWGDGAVDESNRRLKGNENEMSEGMNRIFLKLAGLRHLDPGSVEAQTAIGEWYAFLNKMGTYSMDAFEGLGEMYVADERFSASIDRFGKGLSAFMKEAMKIYSKNRR